MQNSRDVAPHHERTLSLTTVKMTYSQLLEVVNKAHRLAESANQGADKLIATEALSVSDGTDTLRTSVISPDKFSNPPKVGYFGRYEYSAQIGSPVSTIAVTLNDYKSEVTVSGESSEQVETIARSVQAGFDDYSSWAGQNVRYGLGFTIFIGLLVLGYFLSEKTNDGKYYFFPFVAGMLCFILLATSATHILPGTAIYAGDPSFWSRNASLIGGLGTLFGLISVGMAIPAFMQSLRRKRHPRPAN